MLPRHRISGTVHVSSATALDTVVTYVSPAALDDNAERRGVFFSLLHADEIDALVPWTNAFVHFLNEAYDAQFADNDSMTVERAVANTQQRAKQKLQQLISETRSISVSDISYCIGAVNGYDVHIAHSGTVKGYLLHTLKSQYDDEPRYRWIEITNNDNEDEDEASGISIVSGRMQANDTLLLCTESVVDGLGLEQLQKNICRASVDGAKIQLEKAVAAVGGRVGYGAIILRPTVEQVAAQLPPYRNTTSPQRAADSMQHLHQSQEQANQLLDPKRHPNPFNGILDKIRTTKEDQVKQPLAINDTQHTSSPRRPQNPFSVITDTTNARGRQQILDNASRHSKKILDNLSHRLRTLPNSSRRLLLIALMLGYLFTQSLVFLANRQTEETTMVEQQQTVEQIQENLDKAESSLIFNNDQEAARLLSDSETLIATLPRNTRTQDERYRVLADRANALRERLERVNQADTKIVANLNDTTGQPSLLALLNGEIITASTNGTFARIATDGSVNTLNIEGLNAVQARALNVDDTNTLYASTESSEVSIDTKANTLLVRPLTDAKNTTDMAHYQGRLYLLSAKDQQIYRYNGGATFTNPSPWVNGNATVLADSTSMVVDGNVYVLTKSGSLYKYTRGSIQAWSAVTPFGQTEGMSKLVSPNGSPYLYALDTERNRIMMWQKDDGKLVNQFAFPSLGQIVDFTVREDNQIMYLLTDAVVASAAIIK